MADMLSLHTFQQDFTHNRPVPAWLAHLQQQAFASFLQQGLPTRRMEEWKYTNVAPLAKHDFTRAPQCTDISVGAKQLLNEHTGAFAQYTMVFVDGYFAPALSSITEAKDIRIQSLNAVLTHSPDTVAPFYNQSFVMAEHPFAVLNTALMTDGLFLQIDKSIAVDRPIHVIYLTTQTGVASYARNILVLAPNAQATVIETAIGIADKAYLNNTVTEVFLSEDARLNHYKIQQEAKTAYHIAGVHAVQARNSHFMSHAIALGALLARNDISSQLQAPYAHCVLNGLYVTHGRQHSDSHTLIHHAASETVSNEYYKGVADDYSHAVFNGKVIVAQDAQKIAAHQSNKNLLLSGTAEINTKPELQIYANDVKCAHGATVGQLDKNALFYLRARGLSEAAARHVLTFAFVREILQRAHSSELAQHLTEKVMMTFAALSHIQEFL
jgi:Fe-S cluster assembly protein SufD